jgi:hypothetical protein
MKKLTQSDKVKLSEEFGVKISSINKVISVESGGKGFDDETGKIIIQFEPSWFKRQSPYTPSGLWSLNKVERQKEEWKAFNDAFSKDPDGAMKSTSIGLMQVMGFHWKDIGFKSVGEMWDYAKESEHNQLRLGILFIRKNKKMFEAFKDLTKMKNCRTFAYYYNGEKYEEYNYHNKLFLA